ncbi:glycoside hydrolase [Acephala macrosclerotiorum]|nr:glycoside hydrolase [Acephala macrosclerotiorum]
MGMMQDGNESAREGHERGSTERNKEEEGSLIDAAPYESVKRDGYGSENVLHLPSSCFYLHSHKTASPSLQRQRKRAVIKTIIMYTTSFVLIALWVLNARRGDALVLKEEVGRLPALGWNSWNAFHCDVDEGKIMTAANQIVSLGLKEVGYEYVNIDDCWSVQSGRNTTTQQIIPDPVKFPDGISGTADKVHALGLKIGIYSSAGTATCAGYPASIGYEAIDAATWAAWGIDYLKYDNCNIPSNWADEYTACVPEYIPLINGSCPTTSQTAPPGYDWSTSNSAERFRRMRDALLAQNRTILYSLCQWGTADVWAWGNDTGSSWRMSGDIDPSWSRIVEIMNENSFELNSVGFWGHNDADMLEVGNGDLTLEENRSHFAFWAAMKSPVIIGTSLDTLSQTLVDVLKNKYLLAFNQDRTYGGPATPYKWGTNPDWTFNATNPAEYWSGKSEAGVLVLAFNSLNEAAEREIVWSELPEYKTDWCESFEVTDIWTGKNLGYVAGGISRNLSAHDTMGFLVTQKCGGSGGGKRWNRLGKIALT